MVKYSLLEEEMILLSKIIKAYRVKNSEAEKLEGIKTKIISGDLTSSLDENISSYCKEIIENTRLEAKDIIEEANKKAEMILDEIEIKKNKISTKAKIRSEELYKSSKDRGYTEGYISGEKIGLEKGRKEGLKKGQEAADKIIVEALEIKNNYQEMKGKIVGDLEPKILEMIVTIYEKIVGSKIEDQEFILDLISHGISKLDPTDKLTIIVCKEDYDLVLENKNLILAQGSFINSLDIKYDINFKPGDCVFEMDKGNIDFSVEEHLEEIRKTIFKILNNE